MKKTLIVIGILMLFGVAVMGQDEAEASTLLSKEPWFIYTKVDAHYYKLAYIGKKGFCKIDSFSALGTMSGKTFSVTWFKKGGFVGWEREIVYDSVEYGAYNTAFRTIKLRCPKKHKRHTWYLKISRWPDGDYTMSVSTWGGQGWRPFKWDVWSFRTK